MRAGILLLAALVSCPIGALGAAAPEPLAAARKNVESADYRIKGHLVRVEGNGTRTSYGVNIRAHWFPGALRVLLAVDSPGKTRENVLLTMRPDGKSTIQIAHPGDTVATSLPFDKWSDGPLGEQFSYEDFLEASAFWAGQTALGEAKFGARTCDLVQSTPGAADKTHIASVKSWLDRGSGFPVYVEKTMKDSGKVKEFTYFGLRQTGGVWSASQVEAKIHGQAGSILLVIERGSPKAHLGLQDFGLEQLTHF